MGKPIDFREVAAHLAHPTGEMGITVGHNMNRSNGGMTRRAIDLLGISDGDVLLEIGPGNGALADYALGKADNVHYTGLDVSETMVAEANRINQSYINDGRMQFVLTNGNALPMSDEMFDKVFTVNTLYFWKDPGVQLAEIRRVLKLSGVLCLAIASKAFMQGLPFTPFGFRLYTEGEACKLLEDNEFLIDDLRVGKYETTSAAGQVVVREEIIILARKQC